MVGDASELSWGRHVSNHQAVVGEGVRYVSSFVGKLPGSVSAGFATQPTARLGGSQVVVCGRPFLLDGSSIELDPDASQRVIEKSLLALDGRFSILAIGRERAVLATDLLGIGGAFYAANRSGVVVSSHLGQLVTKARIRERDSFGTVASLLGSLVLDGCTPFRNTYRLPAATYIVIDLANGTVVKRRYAEPACLLAGQEGDGDSQILFELLAMSVRRESAGESVGLFLTGGKDSFAIGSALGVVKDNVLALTYGGWRSLDKRQAKNSARVLGLRHRRMRPRRLKLPRYAGLVASFGAGLAGLQVAQHLAGAEWAGKYVNRAFVGFLGDILTGHPFPREGRERQLLRSRLLPWRSSNGPYLRRAFPEEYMNVLSGVDRLYAGTSGLRPSRATMLLDLTHRQATYIGSAFDLMHQYVEVSTPFYYRPLLKYLFTRRDDDLRDQSLYARMLAQARFVERVNRPVDRMWNRIERGMGGSYRTVNWPGTVSRHRDWLSRSIKAFVREDPIATLALESLESDDALPLALFAAPLLEMTHRPATVERVVR